MQQQPAPPPDKPRIGRRRRVSVTSRTLARTTFELKPSMPTWIVFRYDVAPGLTLDEVKTLVRERLVERQPRLRSKYVYRRGGWDLFKEVAVNMDDHVVFASSPDEDVDEARVRNAVCSELTWKCDVAKPMWKFVVFPRVHQGGGDSVVTVLLLVINHCLADGISCMNVIRWLSDEDSVASAAAPATAAAPAITAPPSKKVPSSAFARMYGWFEASTFAFWSSDKTNVLRFTKPLECVKKVWDCEPAVPVKVVKEMSAKLGGSFTVHDILMAVLTRMAVKYFERKNVKDWAKIKIHAMFPVDTRANPAAPPKLANDWNMGRITLPVKLANKSPGELLKRIKRSTDFVKASGSAKKKKALMPTVLYLPNSTILYRLKTAPSAATLTLSNVMGPSRTLSVGGKQLSSIRFYLNSLVGIYFGVASYNGSIRVTLNVDEACETVDAQELGELWSAEFDALRAEIASLPSPAAQ